MIQATSTYLPISLLMVWQIDLQYLHSSYWENSSRNKIHSWILIFVISESKEDIGRQDERLIGANPIKWRLTLSGNWAFSSEKFVTGSPPFSIFIPDWGFKLNLKIWSPVSDLFVGVHYIYGDTCCRKMNL